MEPDTTKDKGLLMELLTRNKIEEIYIRFLRFLHKPLMKNGNPDPYHLIFREFIELTKARDNHSILEVGARNVSGTTRKHLFPHCVNYTGFDIYEGEGVDIVGDAHELSHIFPEDSFDFLYSISVFEHLLSPWKVVLEMNKVLRTGGHIFVATHPVWAPHELPWDFWRFPENAFRALFNEYTGFEIISIAEGLPCKVYSLAPDAPTQDQCFFTLNQGVSIIVKKIENYRSDKLSWDIKTTDILETMYPRNN